MNRGLKLGANHPRVTHGAILKNPHPMNRGLKLASQKAECKGSSYLKTHTR